MNAGSFFGSNAATRKRLLNPDAGDIHLVALAHQTFRQLGRMDFHATPKFRWIPNHMEPNAHSWLYLYWGGTTHLESTTSPRRPITRQKTRNETLPHQGVISDATAATLHFRNHAAGPDSAKVTGSPA